MSEAPRQMGALRRVGTSIGLVLLLLLGSAVCVGLGIWQWNRHTSRSAQVDLVTANYEAEPVNATALLGSDLAASLDPGDVWRPVTLSGRWVPGSGVQLRNRPANGVNASHALALFEAETDDGVALVLLDRGWWEQGTSLPPGVLDLPAQTESVTVRLRLAETPDARTTADGEVYRIDPVHVREVVAARSADAAGTELLRSPLVTSTYGALVTSDAPTLLGTLPAPARDLGNHLSYAFQWWFFALALPVAGLVLVRRDREHREDAARARTDRPLPRPKGGRRRRPSLAEEEDALLDAAEERAAHASETTSR